MQITPGPPVSLTDLLGVRPDVSQGGQSRSPGVHVSDLIALHMSKLYPDLYDTSALPEQTGENWKRMGFLWEDVLTQFFAAKIRDAAHVTRASELVLDGVIGTPDWITWDEAGVILGESKLTWKSKRNFDLYDPKFLAWLFQMRAYCRMLETTRAALTVIWINSDYSRFVPEVAQYDIVFTPQELVENWTMLLNTGRKAGLIPLVPPSVTKTRTPYV